MDIVQQMRVVVAVAERGSLTAAAQHLGTSLPTVVRVLANAEGRLGASLFDRTTRKVHITEEGSLYVESCRRVLGEISDVEDALRDRRSEPQGLLAITAPVLFGRMHVAPVLSEFLARHPQVSARLILLDRVVDLVEEGIDVAIRIGPVRPQGMVAARVGQVRRCLCAAPDLLKLLPAIETPEALADLPFVQHLGLMPASEIRVPHASGERVVAVSNVRFATNDSAAAISACVSGVGIGLFLSYQVQGFVRAGQLQTVLPGHDAEPTPVSMVYAPARRLSARTRGFIHWAKESLAERLS